MGLYDRSKNTRFLVQGSKPLMLKALSALAEDQPEKLEGVEIYVTREVYASLTARGYYTPRPRSGSDRRQAERRPAAPGRDRRREARRSPTPAEPPESLDGEEGNPES
ncbi:MAG: hypothetical protein LBQ61_09760 [Spirochaetales bacterium]|jgi:hypothetical protein|nr:hypothetical protein [Spirochaetales bacterium]